MKVIYNSSSQEHVYTGTKQVIMMHCVCKHLIKLTSNIALCSKSYASIYTIIRIFLDKIRTVPGTSTRTSTGISFFTIVKAIGYPVILFDKIEMVLDFLFISYNIIYYIYVIYI